MFSMQPKLLLFSLFILSTSCAHAGNNNDTLVNQFPYLTKVFALGEDSLHKAALQNDAKKVKDLIDNRCYLNEQDDQGNTPLHYAALANIKAGHFYKDEVSQLLIDAGADIKIQNKNNECAFDYVSESHTLFQTCIDLKTQTEMARFRSKKYSLDSLTNKCIKLQAEQTKLCNANNDFEKNIKSKSIYAQGRYNTIVQSIKRNKIDIAVKSQVLQACQQLKEKKLKKEIKRN